MDKPQLADDPRFGSLPQRVAHVHALDAIVSGWFAEHGFVQISQKLEACEIPFSKVYDIADIEADPHFQAREAIIRLADADHGSLPAPCIVPRIIGRDMPVPRSGPALGEHNAEVYAAFGISADELAQLRAQGVV